MIRDGQSATRLGEMLRLYMYEHRYSVRKLAKVVGIPQANLHRIVQGRSASMDNTMKLFLWLVGEHK